MIEIEIQNETHQSNERLKFVTVPRIGEGIRLREPDGRWASYDVLDLWYQQAEYGEVWVPFLHVRMTPPEEEMDNVRLPEVVPIQEMLRRAEANEYGMAE